jgi:predicted amidohydrolase
MTLAAVVQMVSSSQVSTNLKSLDKVIQKAKDEEVNLLVLPENFAQMGILETDKFNTAEAYGVGVIQDYISQLAKRYGLWIIAGTMPLQTSGARVRASCLVYDNKGLCVARYDKIHLFDVRVSDQELYTESATIEPGNKIVVVDTPIGRVGLSVCYDLRFPELYQELRRKGAQIFTVPAAFTAITGKVHWEILLRARAIENLCYVLAPNQGGEHDNGRSTHGHSLIIDPWGEVLAEAKDTNLIKASIDLQKLEKLRERLPCHAHHVLTE